MGFAPIGPEWPSCYYHTKLSLMLSVYVDDFKLAGREDNMHAGRQMLRKLLHIEPERRVDSKGAVFILVVNI